MKKIFTLVCILYAPIALAQSVISYGLKRDGSDRKLVSFNTSSGVSTDIGIINGLAGVMQGSSFVKANGDYFFEGTDNNNNIRLYTIDVTNATIISNPIVPASFAELQYDCRNDNLYGLRRNNSNWELVNVDALTGSCTLISVIMPDINGVAQGMSTFNASNSHYLFEGNDFNWGMRLYEVDIQTGAVVNSPLLPDYIYDVQFNYFNNTYYGMWRTGSASYLVSVDNVTGTKTIIAVIPGLYGSIQGSAMINSITNAYAFMGTDASFTERYYEINLANGAVISNPVISQLLSEIKNNEYNYCTFMVASTGISEMSTNASFSIAPNPVTDVLYLNADFDISENADITVYSSTGDKIFSVKTQIQNTKLQVGNLKKGLYLLKIESSSASAWYAKFVKE